MESQWETKKEKIIILLCTLENDKITLLSSVSKDIASYFPADELMRFLSSQIGGKGGGRKEMAQGGGNNIAQLETVLNSIENWVLQKNELLKTQTK